MVYDQASEDWEAAVQQQADEMLGEAIEESQMRIKGIFEELKDLEERRAEWWARVEGLVDEAGEFVIELIRSDSVIISFMPCLSDLVLPRLCSLVLRKLTTSILTSSFVIGKTGEQRAAEGSAAIEKTIGLADRKIKAMVSGAGVKKSKGISEMDKLKALMLNL